MRGGGASPRRHEPATRRNSPSARPLERVPATPPSPRQGLKVGSEQGLELATGCFSRPSSVSPRTSANNEVRSVPMALPPEPAREQSQGSELSVDDMWTAARWLRNQDLATAVANALTQEQAPGEDDLSLCAAASRSHTTSEMRSPRSQPSSPAITQSSPDRGPRSQHEKSRVTMPW